MTEHKTDIIITRIEKKKKEMNTTEQKTDTNITKNEKYKKKNKIK